MIIFSNRLTWIGHFHFAIRAIPKISFGSDHSHKTVKFTKQTPSPTLIRIHMKGSIRNRRMQDSNASKLLKREEEDLPTYLVSSHEKMQQNIFQQEISARHFIEQIGGIRSFTNSFIYWNYSRPKIVQQTEISVQLIPWEHARSKKNDGQSNKKVAITNSQKHAWGWGFLEFALEGKTYSASKARIFQAVMANCSGGGGFWWRIWWTFLALFFVALPKPFSTARNSLGVRAWRK